LHVSADNVSAPMLLLLSVLFFSNNTSAPAPVQQRSNHAQLVLMCCWGRWELKYKYWSICVYILHRPTIWYVHPAYVQWEYPGKASVECWSFSCRHNLMYSFTPGSLGPWGRPPVYHRVIAVALKDHKQIGGDPLLVHEPPGWEQLIRMFSLRTLGTIRHGGRQQIRILGNKSSVRQRSARSSPTRRRVSRENVNVECFLPRPLAGSTGQRFSYTSHGNVLTS